MNALSTAVRLLLVCAFCATLVHAQNRPLPDAWPPPPSQTVLSPKLACTDLFSLTGYEFTVATATLIPANANVREYCRVTGQMLPEIRFEVNLPTSWNRRFYMFGDGGYAGSAVDAPSRAGARNDHVSRGFATAGSNSGHQASLEPGASFAQDRQKLLDYGFRALHVTAETARRLITVYYGAKPARSYFESCSNGGRQAMMLAQRFPDDFDGIVAGAPAMDFTGSMLRFTCTAQALAAAPIPYAKLSILSDRIQELCDARDGLKDGLIDDPRRCDFRPSRDLPKCAADADQPDCFTNAQIGALEKIYGDVVIGGKRWARGWPVGGEAADAKGRRGWKNWIIRDEGQTISAGFAESFFRYMGFPEKDPNYKLASFDFDKDPARLDWVRNAVDAVNPDLSRFQARGGRLIMWFGWADEALNAMNAVDYYESVLARMGPATPDFFRLFMAPGVFHCGGGVGPSSFDMLTPLIRWVERGAAPGSIPAERKIDGKVVRTRPLCPYPQAAQYKGAGSIDDAANFTCR
jgi:feruloyl esterase